MTAAHRRHNPLTDEWVLVSPGRAKRPWLGHTESIEVADPVPYDPRCYLCPTNERMSGDTNPAFESTYVFTNDFAALRPDVEPTDSEDGLLRSETQQGTCRVVCYSPRHDLRLSLMTPTEIESVIDMWSDQTAELGEQYQWVQVFENNGEAMGASNPHPHGQIWAGTALPTLPEREDITQRRYARDNDSSLLLDYLDQEHGGERVVVDGEEWVALVPYWATWPFETLVVPKTPIRRITEVDGTVRASLAAVLNELLIRYDNLFEHPFPYSMGWHGAPIGDDDHDHWQLHAHFYPPLLRSATVRKFMVGYELLAEAQRDLTPEEAATRLRELSSTHYSQPDAR
ncbi:MAG: UDP-glucose--hexose-1-phosphate uridylyltransferase [Actinomycetia bacterium]|nr:UDP-glucose--hexose-1-phosphate uridylyltransferase [Actinomycetes bacterium]